MTEFGDEVSGQGEPVAQVDHAAGKVALQVVGDHKTSVVHLLAPMISVVYVYSLAALVSQSGSRPGLGSAGRRR